MPCEILIKARAEYIHDDPAVNNAGIYQPGDLVVGFDLPHEWGIDEALPRFHIWTIPDMTLANFNRWCKLTYGCGPFDSEYEDTLAPVAEGTPTPLPKVVMRRRVYIDPNGLPPVNRAAYMDGKATELPPHTDYVKLKPSVKS